MPIRRSPVDEAARRARRQLEEALRDVRAARNAAGLSQFAVARGLGTSRSRITHWERGAVMPDPVQLARLGRAVGLDLTLRFYPSGEPLRDVGQLRLLGRARAALGGAWTWRSEVPVSDDALDRRAIDAVLVGAAGRIGLEAVTRLIDVQAQVRGATLKQTAAGLDRMVLLLADTRHNRSALPGAAPSLEPAFPVKPREVLCSLRHGRLPRANGVMLL